MPMPLQQFHPAVAAWFGGRFAAPTPAQRAAWPAIAAGRDTLVAAPTGSGKTLTAFLAAIDDLVRRGLADGGLPDETAVLYVSPLKALSNDIALNLELPLAGIRAALQAQGLADVAIRTAVRTGDTAAGERQRMLRRPPHILVTTPESLYVLLGSQGGRRMLSTVRTVIVDEIHAVAGNKRGSHLALSLERLQALTPSRPVRIGLSATQKPIAEVARFLAGAARTGEGGDDPAAADCTIVDTGHAGRRDLALELPPTPLGPAISTDQWQQIFTRLAELVRAHRTTLVFTNTRRMAERTARHLGELLGRTAVAAHHGSLSREARLEAEQRLKRGELQVLVATASLELGLDIGEVDLVCQLGSPRSIGSFLQRAGRSGHAVGGVPRARLFPQSRDDLVECAALLDCVRRGELDLLRVPVAPLDVLAQQLVAETACREWDEDALFALVRGAWPYARLAREDFDAVVRMLSEGFSTRRGQRASYIHRDAVHRRLRERRGARLTALTSGGTIPETADYAVILEPEALPIGTVNEDFAVESLTGDVFQLGNASYRILRVESGRMRVEDARGAPPNIPFWMGEAPGRSDALSLGVSRLREAVAARLGAGAAVDAPAAPDTAAAIDWLCAEVGLDPEAARQLVDYLARAAAVLGAVPSQRQVVLERFLDGTGGTQLVLHAPFGSRINRAWGLALRARLGRMLGAELQAAAGEDAIVLSLPEGHTLALADVAGCLSSQSAPHLLLQALLDSPLLGVRWRWNATTALALPRYAGGRKVPPQLQRMRADDLLAAVFPEAIAEPGQRGGEREAPDHPLVAQTLHDCLHEAMDADGWLRVLRGIEAGDIVLRTCDLLAPSPLAAEALNARPYAFLDDAPLAERRTQAVQARHPADPLDAGGLGRLDPEAIAQVRAQAWPQPRGIDEMYEALVTLGVVTVSEAEAGPGWQDGLQALADDGRATRLVLADASGAGMPRVLWSSVETLPQLQALYPQARPDPPLRVPPEFASQAWSRAQALQALLRARLGALGPTPVAALAAPLWLAPDEVEATLRTLQAEGDLMSGRFTPDAADEEWCERHLLARIHRRTLRHLREEIEPVAARDYLRFLFEWQHLTAAGRMRGAGALPEVLAQLEGFEAPAAAWEPELLAARVGDYVPDWLDDLCIGGRVLWTRLRPDAREGTGRGGALRATPILLLPRREAVHWTRLAPAPALQDVADARAARVVDLLAAQGASFFDEIADGARLLRTELEDVLADLVARGRVHCDSFGGLRALLVPASRRGAARGRRRGRLVLPGVQDAGRWALPRVPAQADAAARDEALAHVAQVLLRRYGVVCWRLLEREAAWLPPWRELVRVYRRLEARGEIRGGRFIAGLSGEQFALPEAVAALRRVRRQPHDGELVVIGAADPANLVGTVLPGTRVPRLPGNRVVYRDGVPLAGTSGTRIDWLVDPDADDRQAVQAALAGSPLRRTRA
ncbi:DEAD/DEAH box helicase [Luteimonas sp. BDR2-5]|uniref:DEAD/DEAH box helicase n=1 Tax=Proluteimonas luteida TaxID=2878685 RepID=UPI001E455E4B|nr:DEAD/DEAH box helicase [Luteimonas sp. BDR2-5]MCD9027211.1 DEAD/DEAH box helicase [Luteimonas sp. BDR2-5]